jgi:Uma2 family endonuclease
VVTESVPALSATLPMGDVTFEEFLEWSLRQEYGKTEYIKGQIYFSQGVTVQHSRVFSFLVCLLGDYLESKKLPGIFLGPKFIMRLADDAHKQTWCEPTLLYLSDFKKEQLHETHLEGAADLVIEVISQKNKKRHYELKYTEYESAGVTEYWSINLLENKTTFYRLNSERKYQEISVDANGLFTSEVIDGLRTSPTWFLESEMPRLKPIRDSW